MAVMPPQRKSITSRRSLPPSLSFIRSFVRRIPFPLREKRREQVDSHLYRFRPLRPSLPCLPDADVNAMSEELGPLLKHLRAKLFFTCPAGIAIQNYWRMS